jgi:hypothetical protein
VRFWKLEQQSPFAASYGNLESGWNDMVNNINKEIGDDGKPVSHHLLLFALPKIV